MRRLLGGLMLLVTLAGCGVEQQDRIPGVWSNGETGRLADVTPNGFYAEVWLDSLVQVSAWEIHDKNELTLAPLCTSLAEDVRSVPFFFDLDDKQDSLAFPQKNGRHTRYLKEPPQNPVDPRLVGLWQRESQTRKKEFWEFTPWGTAIWNRWDGPPGNEKLVAGWANPIRSEEGDLLFGGVEDGALLKWNRPVTYQVSGTGMTLFLPAGIGKKDFVKATRSDLLKAAKAPSR